MATTGEQPWIDMVSGVRRRTLVSGSTMHQMVVTLQAGSHLPDHHHVQEQIIHVVRGRLRVDVAGEVAEVGEGESFYLASDVPHAVDALVTSLIVDTFSPPRYDLLEQDQTAAKRA